MEQQNCNRQAVNVSPERCVSMLSQRFASRGLVKSALLEAKAQIAAEEKTRELAPCAYRLSLLSEATIMGVYKHGKETMSVSDLIRYAEESRSLMPEAEDVEEHEQCSILPTVTDQPKQETAVVAARDLKRVFTGFWKKGLEMSKVWVDVTPVSKKGEKRFPLSTFAAVVAVAVSMMLIVTGALMVTSAETRISTLKSEIAQLTSQVDDLETKLETQSDLMEIRRIAIEKYGMVEEQYLKSGYVSLASEEYIRVYEQKKDREIGLAAILSAISGK